MSAPIPAPRPTPIPAAPGEVVACQVYNLWDELSQNPEGINNDELATVKQFVQAANADHDTTLTQAEVNTYQAGASPVQLSEKASQFLQQIINGSSDRFKNANCKMVEVVE